MLGVFVKINGRSCLVVGGGAVAERKIRALLAEDAVVTVVSPQATAAIRDWAANGALTWRQRPYAPGEAAGYFLVIGATNAPAVNKKIHDDGMTSGCLVNIVDVPELGNFYFPAVVRRGDLTVAVSTAGACPGLSKRLRRRLEGEFGTAYEDLLRTLRAFRERLLATVDEPERRRQIMNEVLDGPELQEFLAGNREHLKKRLDTCISS